MKWHGCAPPPTNAAYRYRRWGALPSPTNGHHNTTRAHARSSRRCTTTTSPSSKQRKASEITMNETKPDQLVAAAADSLRTFTHQTRTGQLPDGCMPAPDAYRILGSAAELAYALPQAL